MAFREDKSRINENLSKSENIYHQIFQHALNSIFITNLEGIIIDCNKSALKMLGYAREELIGTHRSDIIEFDLKTPSKKKINQLRKDGFFPVKEHKMKRKDGKSIHVRSNHTLIKKEGKELVVITSEDISEQKNMKKSLVESEEMFRAITEQSPMGIIIYQSNKLIYVNHQAENILGYDINQLKNMSFEEYIQLIHADHRYPYKALLRKLKEHAYVREESHRIRFKHKEKGIIWISDYINEIIYGGEQAILSVFADVTSQKQAELNLEAQNKKLSEINALKNELISRTSHELKTPLISIKGFTELLLSVYKERFDEEIRDILKDILHGSERLQRTINSLLETSRLERQEMELNLHMEDLSFLIRFCVKELKSLAQLRNHTIDLKLLDRMETMLDKERIYEVISNLIVNAIKFTPVGGEIVVSSRKIDNEYVVSVKDSGIGITENEKPKLFRQFGKIERYGKGWDINIEGTGLGLYIAKKIVKLHGGKIWVESKGRNEGATFSFSLPILLE